VHKVIFCELKLQKLFVVVRIKLVSFIKRCQIVFISKYTNNNLDSNLKYSLNKLVWGKTQFVVDDKAFCRVLNFKQNQVLTGSD